LTIDPEVARKIQSEEYTWLQKVHNQYNSINDFMLSWKKSSGAVMFSCPALVATSYRYRLGLLGREIQSFSGQRIQKSDKVVNVLSSRYLQVEANADLIVKATYPEVEEKIAWHFY
jgi:hypothetical protein